MEREPMFIISIALEFRAWDGKRMHYDFQWIKTGDNSNDWIVFISDKNPLSSKPHPLENPHCAKDFIIMQYIGRKDKNGNKIFAGDFVSYYNYSLTKKVIVLVEWSKLSSGFSPFLGSPDCCGGNCIFDKEVEIIGNIFQNPELLK